MPCLFNTNLAFRRGGKERERKKGWTGAARQKRIYPRTGIIFFVSIFPLRRLRFHCLGVVLLRRISSFTMNLLVDHLSRVVRRRSERENGRMMRIARKISISENHRSYEFTRGHLAGPPSVSRLISGDLPGARVISILDPKNSGVSYGFS